MTTSSIRRLSIRRPALRRLALRQRWLAPAAGALLCWMGPQPEVRAQRHSEWVHQRRIDVEAPWGRTPVLVTFPRRADRRSWPPDIRYPVVVALHGRGEAANLARGHLGWAVQYQLPNAFGALLQGEVSRRDYRGFATERHLSYVNASLSSRPFRGMVVVTPAVPDLMAAATTQEDVQAFADWVAGPLLQAVRERFPGTARSREATGIDGVSMGGMLALEVAFRHPGTFGAVGAIQPAIRERAVALADRAVQAGQHAPLGRIRLLSSEDDPFLAATRHLSDALRERRVTHTLTVVPGPHGYVFNRGPAGLEMLLFQGRALQPEQRLDGDSDSRSPRPRPTTRTRPVNPAAPGAPTRRARAGRELGPSPIEPSRIESSRAGTTDVPAIKTVRRPTRPRPRPQSEPNAVSPSGPGLPRGAGATPPASGDGLAGPKTDAVRAAPPGAVPPAAASPEPVVAAPNAPPNP